MVFVAALLPAQLSASARETMAKLVTTPVAVGVTTIATVARLLSLIVPRLQITIWPMVMYIPWLGATETSVTSGGNTFITRTPVAAAGPVFVIAIE